MINIRNCNSNFPSSESAGFQGSQNQVRTLNFSGVHEELYPEVANEWQMFEIWHFVFAQKCGSEGFKIVGGQRGHVGPVGQSWHLWDVSSCQQWTDQLIYVDNRISNIQLPKTRCFPTKKLPVVVRMWQVQHKHHQSKSAVQDCSWSSENLTWNAKIQVDGRWFPLSNWWFPGVPPKRSKTEDWGWASFRGCFFSFFL